MKIIKEYNQWFGMLAMGPERVEYSLKFLKKLLKA